ncbi:MAG: 5'-3' exonuclease H3TH domain-containing protein [Planctomycetota bacterium]
MIELLVDANNIVGRFFATKEPGQVADSVVYHIARCGESLKCESVVIAWDDRRTFRHDLFDGYKATRKKIDGIKEARERTKQSLINAGYRSVVSPNHEADDAIATIAHRNTQDGVRSIIYSGDKDLHQVVAKGVTSQLMSFRFSYGSTECKWRTFDGPHGMVENLGISASQWVDYRSLTGDPSDNIKGFPSIGPKRAAEILGKWGSIDGYFESPTSHCVSKSVERSMNAGRSSLELTRQLIRLNTSAPLEPADGSVLVAAAEPPPF